MKKAILLFFAMTMALLSNAQECKYTDLSDKFDYVLRANIKSSSYVIHSADIEISVQDKSSGKIVQNITYTSGILFIDSYKNCGTVRSYITGKNKDAPVTDNDYGNLVVADLNFDGKEDFAVKFDAGGNRGSIYNFYIQQADGLFARDTYLSNNMLYFPASINNINKTLLTTAQVGTKGHTSTVYQYNGKVKNWARGKHQFITN